MRFLSFRVWSGLIVATASLLLTAIFFKPQYVPGYATRRLFSTSFTRISTDDSGLVYKGRWLTSLNRLEKHGSFPGVSIEFSTINTTHIVLDLGNWPSQQRPRSEFQAATKPSILLAPKKNRHEQSGPVKIQVQIQSRQHNITYHQEAVDTLVLASQLDTMTETKVRVVLRDSTIPSTVQFRGLWLSKGGHLLPSEIKQPPSAQRLVEVMAPASLVGRDTSSSLNSPSEQFWFELVEHNFSNTTLSAIPLSSQNCMAEECQKAFAPTSTTADRIFFRAGTPGTDLYKRFWPFDSISARPSALILMLGLADVQAFLDSGNLSKQGAQNFVENLSSAYAKFIQTVRRTAYSQSYNAASQTLLNASPDANTDESYLYNSAPSVIPILLVLPPIPSQVRNSRQARLLLSHAANKVLDQLKYHIGDKKTFVIDTAGWLDDEDFRENVPAAGSLLNISLSGSGHIKLAHHLSAHLCPHMIGSARKTGVTKCSFDKHEEFTGNLYVPETANVGKLVEEHKIARMKGILGFA